MNFNIHEGDALTVLREMPDASVHCVVTSPPYWGLRDYGTGIWKGGDENCDHKPVHGSQGKTGQRADRSHPGIQPCKDLCPKCGAVRIDKQLGLETLHDCSGWATGVKCGECFICKMVQVFAEVRRVLRPDGTTWINMGDSYADGGRGSDSGSTLMGSRRNQEESRKVRTRESALRHEGDKDPKKGPAADGGVYRRGAPGVLKPKDLLGMPWRFAFALQADGWYLRQDLIWHKPNPMPESVTDRCTKAHEYIFLFSKSKRYYYNADAIKEPASLESHMRRARGPGNKTHKGVAEYEATKDERHRTKAGLLDYSKKMESRDRTPAGWHQGTRPATPSKIRYKANAPGVNPKAAESAPGSNQNSSFSAAIGDLVDMRNKRSVWTIPTMPTPEAHFATFPLELPEICLLAGCPEGGTVLDPFAGAGTTAMACLKNGRGFVGIELNRQYIAIASERIMKRYSLFMEQEHM